MNPFNNRWALLFVVAAFLLLVAELVGTDERGGVLSQLVGGRPAEAPPPESAPIEMIEPAPPVVEEVEEEEVPEEDLPQLVTEEQTEDVGQFETIDVSLDEAGGDVEVIEDPAAEEPVE